MNAVKRLFASRSLTDDAEKAHTISEPSPFKGLDRGRINPRLACLLRPQSAVAESYSRLRLALERMGQDDRGFVVAITSPIEGDGKTLTAVNLAGALAQDAGARVLLMDLNLRTHGSHVRDYLDLRTLSGPGVVDWIKDPGVSEGEIVHFIPGFNLYIISAGAKADVPYELLKSPRLDQLFDYLREQYDFVIVNTPAVVGLPDAELISRVVDRFIIVVRQGSTPRSKLGDCLDLMVQEKTLGLLFNCVPNAP